VAIGPIIDIATGLAADGSVLRNDLGMQPPRPGFKGRVVAARRNSTPAAPVLGRSCRTVLTHRRGTHTSNNSRGLGEGLMVLNRKVSMRMSYSAAGQLEQCTLSLTDTFFVCAPNGSTERCRWPSTSELAAEVARPHSLQ